MRQYKIFAAIADVHIGIKHISAKEMKRQLKKNFFDVLKSFPVLDGIFVCGDISHTILSLNSDNAEVYLWFVDQIYKIARAKQSTVIIVKGTLSHDVEQLANVRHYVNNDDGVDFRIYETIEETTIWGNYKVLILPDVKIRHDEEVENYLTKDQKYDLIFGHGLIDTMKFFVQESENMPTKTYEYNVDDLIDTSKGPVIFGHIHQHQYIRNKFFYTGPFTLLERGGINSGFLVCGIYDKDRTKFCVEQYVNPDSARYFDLHVTKSMLEDFPIDDIIQAIDEIIEDTKANDLITLRITRGDQMDSIDKVAILETRYRSDKRFSIVKKIKSKSEEISDQKNQERKDKYSYILDQSSKLSDILYKYYKEDYVPNLADQFSEAARLTIEQFKAILGEM